MHVIVRPVMTRAGAPPTAVGGLVVLAVGAPALLAQVHAPLSAWIICMGVVLALVAAALLAARRVSADDEEEAWEVAADVLAQWADVACTAASLRDVCDGRSALLLDADGRQVARAQVVRRAGSAWVLDVRPEPAPDTGSGDAPEYLSAEIPDTVPDAWLDEHRRPRDA